MNETPKQTMQEKMQALTVRYLKQLSKRKAVLERLLLCCENNELGDEGRLELQSQAHKLSGSGASYGFPEISRLGGELENQIIDNPGADSLMFVPLTRKLLDVCSKALEG